jgi:MerR family transcriptional regulator, thiopeptide resistance regulator
MAVHWRVGELAARTGLTVRTLHHYDRLGLATPSARTPSGHRLYGEQDVQRLYRVLALRALGLPLGAIAEALAGAGTLRELLAEHRTRVEAQLRTLRQLADRLGRLADAVDRAGDPSAAAVLNVIEEMTTMERTFDSYYTAEQLAQRREQVGEQAITDVQAEWPRLIAAVQAAADAGTDPADPAVQALARRWTELLGMFDGGDPGVRDSLKRLYAENGEELARQGGPSPQLIEYVQRANAAGR